MDFEELDIPGAWQINCVKHEDNRGRFSEWFKFDELFQSIDMRFNVRQANVSYSNEKTLRGIHYSLALEGQRKWIKCMAGSILDFIVDIRVGSPTFGKWISVELNSDEDSALLLSAGLGHAFVSLENESCVAYLTSSSYSPKDEFTIQPFDATLGIDWKFPNHEMILSEKDRDAPLLATQIEQKLLPYFEERIRP